MTHLPRWIGTLVCSVVVAVMVPASSANNTRVVERLQGNWRYAGDDSERQVRLDAIDATVRQMPWIMRGMARKRITKSTEIHELYVFRVEAEEITIGEDGPVGHTSRWDGTPVSVRGDRGAPATLTRSLEDGGLRSHHQQAKGSGTEIYNVSPDGQTMTVTVIVSSPRLPSDIEYDLTYRRQE
jgi:hypothetical protein